MKKLDGNKRDRINQSLLKQVATQTFNSQGLLFNLVQISYQRLPVCVLSKVTAIVVKVVFKSKGIPLLKFFLRSDLVRSNINMVPSVAYMYWTLYQYWQKSDARKIKKCFHLIYKDQSFALLSVLDKQKKVLESVDDKLKKKSLECSVIFFSILRSGDKDKLRKETQTCDKDKVRKETQTSVYAFLLE